MLSALVAFPPPSAAPKAETIAAGPAVCDGDVAAGLGHPRVFLDVSAQGRALCPYCSREFVLAKGARAGHGH